MKRTTRWILAALAAAAVIASTLAGRGTSGSGRPVAASEPAPDPTGDIGTGERLILVIGGDFATRPEAETAGGSLSFGEVQGFFVAPTEAFDGIPPGRWLLVSAFRTEAGATSFSELARAAGAGTLRRAVAVYRGAAWIGLGLEASPDGSGPLIETR